jgi:hypothetical protein
LVGGWETIESQSWTSVQSSTAKLARVQPKNKPHQSLRFRVLLNRAFETSVIRRKPRRANTLHKTTGLALCKLVDNMHLRLHIRPKDHTQIGLLLRHPSKPHRRMICVLQQGRTLRSHPTVKHPPQQLATNTHFHKVLRNTINTRLNIGLEIVIPNLAQLTFNTIILKGR